LVLHRRKYNKTLTLGRENERKCATNSSDP
jgi:hypothetical protein